MKPVAMTDNDQAVDTERIKAMQQGSQDTRELVRKVAEYLFLEKGIYPSAAKIHALTQQGSMGTITDEMNRFWTSIRAKLVQRQNFPNLPQEVADKLSELGGALWEQSMAAAAQNFEQAQAQLSAITSEAQESAAQAAAALSEARAKFQTDTAQALEQVAKLTQELKKTSDELISSKTEAQMLQAERDERAQECVSIRQQITDIQQRFDQQLQTARQEVAQANDRAQESAQRSLLEIDKARQEAKAKIQETTKLLEASQAANKKSQLDLETANKQLLEAAQALKEALTEQKSQAAAAAAASESNAKEIASLQKDKEELQKQVQALTNANAALANANQQLQDKILDQLEDKKPTKTQQTKKR